MRTIFAAVALLLALLPVQAQKKIYIPEELRAMDLNNPESQWSWSRSVQTENLVFFWEKGFGDNLSNPPQLEGRPMAFDIENLKTRVEHFYRYFRDTLKFSLPGSKCDRYKMMVMIKYSLEGTAYGGTYDNFIGALWVAPNRIQDRKLNCLAHELGHSFQLQIAADSISPCWGGGGIYEMTSQWMLWQVNPDWVTDENYHFTEFCRLAHKAFLAGENVYHSPYVLEYWAEKRGLPFIAELYRNGKIGETPADTYRRLAKVSLRRFGNEMFDCYTRLLDFNFTHARSETRPYIYAFNTPLRKISGNRYAVSSDYAPEPYGFNAIKLDKAPGSHKPKFSIRRLTPANGCRLRARLVEFPHCRYILVMNEPQKENVPLDASKAIEYEIEIQGGEPVAR